MGKSAYRDVLQGKAYPKKAVNLFYCTFKLLTYITLVVIIFDAHIILLSHIHQHLCNPLKMNI